MGGMSPIHWVIVLVVVLLIFGTKKLRNIGSDRGAAVKGFKDGIKPEDAKAAEAKKPAEAAKSTGEVTLKEVHASLEHLNKSMAQMLTYTQQTATASQQQVKATKNLSGNKFS